MVGCEEPVILVRSAFVLRFAGLLAVFCIENMRGRSECESMRDKKFIETPLRGTELMPTITPLSRQAERGARGEAGSSDAEVVRSKR
ncbi:hypothetical protein WS86_12580 [Burkholderia savannae]|nr:hypothetical protein WS78_12265 [Burkholderia savannae]AOJ81357.1 hypothetical protein WS86_12580 [Burkholderia savannae]